MKRFDLVVFLITLAGKLQERRHAKLVAREAALIAAQAASQKAIAETISARWDAKWLHTDIARVTAK